MEVVETKHDLLTTNYTQVFEEANPQNYAPSTFEVTLKMHKINCFIYVAELSRA